MSSPPLSSTPKSQLIVKQPLTKTGTYQKKIFCIQRQQDLNTDHNVQMKKLIAKLHQQKIQAPSQRKWESHCWSQILDALYTSPSQSLAFLHWYNCLTYNKIWQKTRNKINAQKWCQCFEKDLKCFLNHVHTFYVLKLQSRASLVAQWLRIRLPMQGTQARALVREDPICRGANKPMRHNYWACALEPVRLESMLCNKRSHRTEKPVHCKEE